MIAPGMDLPSDDSLRGIVQTYAALRARHGDAIGAPTLVCPTSAFFPDEFRGDPSSVAHLVRRMMSYGPIADDLPVELAFVEPDGGQGGCGSIACGSPAGKRDAAFVEELDDGYRVVVAATDLGHPDLLTASLARSVGAIVLYEAGEEESGTALATRAEIAAVACGFGVVLANGAAVWGKSCGGLRMVRGTALSVEEAAVALALFVGAHGVPESEARGHLRPTQREAFDIALGWTASNPRIVASLRQGPALLEAGGFDIEPARGLLGRWLHKRKLERELQPRPSTGRPARSADQQRRFEEARALVDGTDAQGE
jgi:hypothetical protein